MKIDMYYYNSYDDFAYKKNLRKSHFAPVTAYRYNKDLLRIYFYDKCLFNSDKANVYIAKVVFINE